MDGKTVQTEMSTEQLISQGQSRSQAEAEDLRVMDMPFGVHQSHHLQPKMSQGIARAINDPIPNSNYTPGSTTMAMENPPF